MNNSYAYINALINLPYLLIVIPIIYFIVRKRASYKISIVIWTFSILGSFLSVVFTLLMFWSLEGWGLIFPIIVVPAALVHFVFLIFLIFKLPVSQNINNKRLFEKAIFIILGLSLVVGSIYLVLNRRNDNIAGRSDIMYTWMPDSQKVLVAGETNLYFKMASNGGNQLLAKNSVSEGDRNKKTKSIIVSKSGQKAYLSSSQGIFVFDINGNSFEQIYNNPRNYTELAEMGDEGLKILGWSKDNQGFYFMDDYIHSSDYDEKFEQKYGQLFIGDPADIYYFNLEENKATLLLSDIFNPELSPEGGFLLIFEPENYINSKKYINVIDLSNLTKKQVYEMDWDDENRNTDIKGSYEWFKEGSILVWKYNEKNFLEEESIVMVDMAGNKSTLQLQLKKGGGIGLISQDGNVIESPVIEQNNSNDASDLTEYSVFYNLELGKSVKINQDFYGHFAQYSPDNRYFSDPSCDDYDCDYYFYKLNF